MAAVQPPADAFGLAGAVGDLAAARIDEVREVLVERLLALGRLRRTRDRDLDEDLVDAAAVAGQGQERHLGVVAGGGQRRVDGRLRTDVALRGVEPTGVEPALEGVVEHQPRTGQRDDDQPGQQGDRCPAVDLDDELTGPHEQTTDPSATRSGGRRSRLVVDGQAGPFLIDREHARNSALLLGLPNFAYPVYLWQVLRLADRRGGLV